MDAGGPVMRIPRVVVAAAAAVLVVMWTISGALRVARPSPGVIDRGWDAVAGVQREPVLHAIAEAFAVVGTGVPVLLVTAAVALLVGALRGWSWSAFVVLAGLASALDVTGMKALSMRSRPDAAFGAGTSFPSGHTAGATLLAVVVILLVPRLAVRIAAASFAIAMAWSRTALHAHWLTDVLAGLLVGTATAVLLHAAWAAMLRRSERRRRPRRAGPVARDAILR
ncbi:phosphatase PAP2 family protein [Amnibacterium kyonggiense]